MNDEIAIEDSQYLTKELNEQIDFYKKYVEELETEKIKLRKEIDNLKQFLADSVAQGKTQR